MPQTDFENMLRNDDSRFQLIGTNTIKKQFIDKSEIRNVLNDVLRVLESAF